MSTRTVVGHWLLPDGITPATGHVLLVPNRRVVLVGPPAAMLAERPLKADLDDTGAIALELPCTGTDDTNPAEWAWDIVERLDTVDELRWSFVLPEDIDALDLATIRP